MNMETQPANQGAQAAQEAATVKQVEQEAGAVNQVQASQVEQKVEPVELKFEQVKGEEIKKILPELKKFVIDSYAFVPENKKRRMENLNT
jgi:iron uptake system EfeUOB component EfeO/EfeM